jgi:CheY-like chemotaxis protein
MPSRAPELETLLPAIAGAAELLLSRRGADRDELQALRQLVGFARRGLGLQPLDLNRTIRRSEPLLARLAGEGVEIATSPGAVRARVFADPGELEQAIANLVLNAAEAMSGRGGKIVVETATVTVSGQLDVPDGTYVLLGVSDDGPGMDAATLERALEPFFSTTDARGLGLTVAYGTARQLGGELVLYSEPGHGTSVKIYLPLAEQPVPGDAAGEPEPETSGTVLLAEDNAAVRMWTSQVLEVLGFAVLDAADGQEALVLAQSHDGPIDALVTDVVMPGIGGPELAEKVRALRPEIGVLLVSGYTDRSVVERGLLKDGTSFLQKPFSTQDLGDAVRSVLPSPAR